MISTILHLWALMLFAAFLLLVVAALRAFVDKVSHPPSRQPQPLSRGELARQTGQLEPFVKVLLWTATVIIALDLLCSPFISK